MNYLGETYDYPFGITHCRDAGLGPEFRAIFAHAPPVTFHPALHERFLQLALWFAGRLLPLWVQLGKILADHFFSAVAVDPLCTGIPGGDPAVQIKHEDRVVLHTFQKKPATLVRFLQHAVRLPLRHLIRPRGNWTGIKSSSTANCR